MVYDSSMRWFKVKRHNGALVWYIFKNGHDNNHDDNDDDDDNDNASVFLILSFAGFVICFSLFLTFSRVPWRMTLHGSVFELNNNKTCFVFYFYYYSQLLKHYNEMQKSIQFSLKHVDYYTIIYRKNTL